MQEKPEDRLLSLPGHRQTPETLPGVPTCSPRPSDWRIAQLASAQSWLVFSLSLHPVWHGICMLYLGELWPRFNEVLLQSAPWHPHRCDLTGSSGTNQLITHSSSAHQGQQYFPASTLSSLLWGPSRLFGPPVTGNTTHKDKRANGVLSGDALGRSWRKGL